MTNEEIFEAVKSCSDGTCSKCPLKDDYEDVEECMDRLMCYALDLIERQQAEIEQLTDKQTPNSKRAPFDNEAITCGNCDSDITDSDFTHCPYCGQKLDWSCLSDTETTFECDGKTYIIQFDDGEE